MGVVFMVYEKIRTELTKYYFDELPALVDAQREKVYAVMDEFAENHPDAGSYFLKAKMYDVLAENVMPKFFEDIPFCFELGSLMPRCDGLYYRGGDHANGWLMERNKHLYEDLDPENYAELKKQPYFFVQCGIFADFLHLGLPMNKVFSVGLSGVLEEISKTRKDCKTTKETEFVDSAEAGIKALIKIAQKISAAAKDAGRPGIAEMSANVPYNPPKTFIEGLYTLGFMRKALGTLEGYGFSSMGRPDLLLAPLFENDLKNGVSREEMYDLVAKFLLIWDCTNDRRVILDDGFSYELENSLTLGGCDSDGNPVFNEVTKLFIDARDNLKCMYPKMMLRYSANSPEEYLKLISRSLASGQSYSLYENDDVTIPALVGCGTELKDARDYLVGGCWDVLTPDFNNKFSGEYYHISSLFFELMKPDGGVIRNLQVEFLPFVKAKSFEELYSSFLKVMGELLVRKHVIQNRGSKIWEKVCPAPALSALMKSPLEMKRDMTAGGIKYSRECVYFTAFAEVVDSLYVIKKLCFDEKVISLEELLKECENDWPNEELRQKAISVGSFGDGDEESTAFAGKFYDDLCALADDVPTAYGGKCRPGFNVYTEIVRMGLDTPALPNGRKKGYYLSQGITPSRLQKENSLSDLLNSYKLIDFKKTSGNSSITLSLPVGGMDEEKMAMILKVIASCGLQAIQPSCISKEDLLAAKADPDNHKDIIVRVCGFSSPFVCLGEQYQDEIIARNISNV